MKLVDSPKVDLKKKLKYDDMPDNATPDIRVERPTGEVESGSPIQGFHSPVQPDPAREGAAPARVRTEIPAGGHHVSGGAVAEPFKHEVIGLNKNLAKHAADSDARESPAPTPEAKSRAEYVKSQREAKDRTFESPSGRKPLKELAAKSDGV